MEVKRRNRTTLLFIACFLITAMMILLTSCAKKNAVAGFVSAELNGSGDKIKITAQLTEQVYTVNKGSNIYLFELEPGRSVNDINALRPIERNKISEKMTFTVPLTEGGVSRLCHGFVFAFFNTNTNLYEAAVNNVAYIANAEKLAQNKDKYPETPGVKGLVSVLDSDAVALGISHAVIDVPVEKYIKSAGTASSLTNSYGGKSYFYDREAVETLDARIGAFNAAGVNVYLRFVLNTPITALPASITCIAFPNTDTGAAHYALNFSDIKGAGYIAALFDFMAERYTEKDGEHGFAASYIIGDSANSPTVNNFAGTASYETYIASYATALRTANSILTSYYANGRVYASIDNCWQVTSGRSTIDATGAKFLFDLASLTNISGDFGWRVVAHIGASAESNDRVWYDDVEDGAHISPLNISTLTSALASTSGLLYEGQPRGLTVMFKSAAVNADSASQMNQAASYVYTYYKMAKNGGIEAFIYSDHADRDGNTSGLRAANAMGIPSDKKSVYDFFKSVDTDSDINSAVATILKDSDWASLYSAYSERVRVKNTVVGNASEGDSVSYETAPLVAFDDGTLRGFSASGAGVAGLNRSDNRSVLEAVLKKSCEIEEPYIVKRDIKKGELKGKYLLIPLTLNASGEIPPTTCGVTLTLEQSNGEGGKIYSSSVTVATENSVILVFNIDEFNKKLGKNDITLCLSFRYSGTSDMKATVSEVLTGKEQKNVALIIILSVIGVLAVGAGITGFVIWFRKNYTVDINLPKKNSGEKPEKKIKKIKSDKHADDGGDNV